MLTRSYSKLQFGDLRQDIDELCADIPVVRRSGPLRILTFGSCFAMNLGTYLKAKGYEAETVGFTEVINTPLANLAMLDFSLKGEKSRFARMVLQLKEMWDESKRRELTPIFDLDIAGLLSSHNVVVLTIGVGFDWVDRATGQFVIRPDVRNFRAYGTVFPTAAEQAKRISALLALISRRTQAQVFVTLSPVPCEFSMHFKSAVMSDCLSKSTLRSALHDALRVHKNVIYFPAFEVFRWLPAHHGSAFFGADGKVRHPNADVVELVVQAFTQQFLQRDESMGVARITGT